MHQRTLSHCFLFAILAIESQMFFTNAETTNKTSCEGDDVSFPWELDDVLGTYTFQVTQHVPGRYWTVIQNVPGRGGEMDITEPGFRIKHNRITAENVTSGFNGRYKLAVATPTVSFPDIHLNVIAANDCPDKDSIEHIRIHISSSLQELNNYNYVPNYTVIYKPCTIIAMVNIPPSKPPTVCIVKDGKGGNITFIGAVSETRFCWMEVTVVKDKQTYDITFTLDYASVYTGTGSVRLISDFSVTNTPVFDSGNGSTSLSVQTYIVALVFVIFVAVALIGCIIYLLSRKRNDYIPGHNRESHEED